MKNKDFREIQVSSSLLVVIFLGVLALGVFIFLLGVSVGKKEVQAATPSQIVTQQIPEPVKEPPVKPAGSDTSTETQSPGLTTSAPVQSQQPAADSGVANPAAKKPVVDKAPAPAPKPAAETKKPAASAPSGTGLFYVQVAAYTERAQAQVQVDKCKKLGFTAQVNGPRPGETTPRYRVRLGGYPTRDRALEALSKYKAAVGKTDAYVLKD